MATVSGSTGYSVSGSGSKGLSGLMSGMDTQSMVEKMLSGTQAKIDKQNQSKQVLSWKQDAYRNVISMMRNLKLNTMSFEKPESNIASSGFFNAMNISMKSDYVRATAGSNAKAGKITIDQISQLAESRNEKSTFNATGVISGDIDLSKFKREVTLSLDGTEVDLQVRGATNAEMVANLQTDLDTAFGANAVKAEISKDGIISLTPADDTKKIGVTKGSELGLKMLGLKVGTPIASLTGKADAAAQEVTLSVNLDGVSKNIKLNTNATNLNDFASSLQSSINKAFGNGIVVDTTGGKLNIKTTDGSRQVTLTGNEIAMGAMGIKNGQSTKINTKMAIGDINFAKELNGSAQRFSINGVTFDVTAGESLESVISRINSSAADVEIRYSAEEDRFSIKSKTSGEGVTIDMDQQVGNFLSVLFGEEGTGSVAGNAMSDKSILKASNVFSPDFVYKEGEQQLMVNGEAVTIKLDKKADGTAYTLDELKTAVIDALASKGVTASFTEASDKLTLHVPPDSKVSFGEGLMGMVLGFSNGQTNGNSKATATTTLEQMGLTSGTFTVGGDTFDFAANKNMTADDFASWLNTRMGGTASDQKVSFDATSGNFQIVGVTGNASITSGNAAGASALEALFGAKNIELNSAPASRAVISEGQNAKAIINGIAVERNTNNFAVDGVNLELVKTTKNADGTWAAPIDIGLSRNTDSIYEGIENFVKEYNSMVEKLTGTLKEETTYRKYPPLTAAQKGEMSESEIKLWEEKAKGGLLKSDQLISSIMSEMRAALYAKPDGSDIALYDIGIDTDGWETNGKLVITDPSKLRTAIENNIDNVQRLFSSEDGIAVRLGEVIDSATKVSSGSSGSLIDLAGTTTSQQGQYSIGKQMQAIDKQIESLKRTYESEKKRYWSQFNAMEQMVAQMNQQSSWLSSQFA